MHYSAPWPHATRARRSAARPWARLASPQRTIWAFSTRYSRRCATACGRCAKKRRRRSASCARPRRAQRSSRRSTMRTGKCGCAQPARLAARAMRRPPLPWRAALARDQQPAQGGGADTRRIGFGGVATRAARRTGRPRSGSAQGCADRHRSDRRRHRVNVPDEIRNDATAAMLTLHWRDGRTQRVAHSRLREACPCAFCKRVRLAGGAPIAAPGLTLAAIEPMGYGVPVPCRGARADRRRQSRRRRFTCDAVRVRRAYYACRLLARRGA